MMSEILQSKHSVVRFEVGYNLPSGVTSVEFFRTLSGQPNERCEEVALPQDFSHLVGRPVRLQESLTETSKLLQVIEFRIGGINADSQPIRKGSAYRETGSGVPDRVGEKILPTQICLERIFTVAVSLAPSRYGPRHGICRVVAPRRDAMKLLGRIKADRRPAPCAPARVEAA